MTLKELLGSDYKDGMTLAEAEKVLEGKNLANLSDGKYVAKEKYDRLNEDYSSERNRFNELEKRTKNYDELLKFKSDTEAKAAQQEVDDKLVKAGWKKEHLGYAGYLISQGKLDKEKLEESSKAFLKDNPTYGEVVKENPPTPPVEQTPPSGASISTDINPNEGQSNGGGIAKSVVHHPWNAR